jgi:hypothetical protein
LCGDPTAHDRRGLCGPADPRYTRWVVTSARQAKDPPIDLVTQYGWGIDLGATRTSVAVRNADGRVETVRLGERRAEIPSLVFVEAAGGLLFGEEAEDRGPTEPARLARDFKRRIGDMAPILAGGTPFSAHALTGKLLGHVVDRVTHLRNGPPGLLTVTHPASWGPYRMEQLGQAVRIAAAGPVVLRGEAEAVAIRHATTRRIAPGETVIAYHLDGATEERAGSIKSASNVERGTVDLAGTVDTAGGRDGPAERRPSDIDRRPDGRARGPADAALGAAPVSPYPTDTMLIRVDTGADSSAERVSKVYTFTPGAGAPRTELPGTEPGDELPKWSHNRAQIAVTHNTGNGFSDIYLMSADGSNRRKVLEDVIDGRVAWSGGDDRIAYVRTVGGINQIFVQPLDGSDPTQLTHSPEPKDDPAWSADDRSIIYWRERDGVKQIYELPVGDPAEPGRLITGPATDPAPSPDGSRILHTNQSGTGAASTSDIWLVNADGSNPHRVTSNPEREMVPSWSPDGTWFALVRGPYERPTRGSCGPTARARPC